MPITFKDYNIDQAGDGFDPLMPYQMVPINGSRDFTVQTGDFQAELVLKQTNVTSMSNFRIIRSLIPNSLPLGLPGPGFFVQRQVIPARSVVRFALTGHAVGAALLEGRDLPGGRAPLNPDFNLVISVKPKEIKRFAVCHVFDRVNRDTGQRLNVNQAFVSANTILEDQSNFNIVNIDAAGNRTITLSGTTGRTFDFFNAAQTRRVVDTFNTSFPGVFATVHAVIFVFRVPLSHTFSIRGRARPIRVIGFNQRAQRGGTTFNMILVGRLRPNQVPNVDTTLAHEIGHSLGLEHLPENDSPLIPRLDVPGRPQMDLFMHNLMFPVGRLRFARLNGFQVERLHLKPNVASNINI